MARHKHYHRRMCWLYLLDEDNSDCPEAVTHRWVAGRVYVAWKGPSRVEYGICASHARLIRAQGGRVYRFRRV